MKLIYISMMLLLCISIVSAEHQLPTNLVTDDTGLLEGMGNWANNVTNGMFWTFMLMGFCLVLFIAASKHGTARAFGYAGVTGLFGSITLIIVGWMPWWIGSIFIIVGAVSIASMLKAK